jgi:hypothetical protein
MKTSLDALGTCAAGSGSVGGWPSPNSGASPDTLRPHRILLLSNRMRPPASGAQLAAFFAIPGYLAETAWREWPLTGRPQQGVPPLLADHCRYCLCFRCRPEDCVLELVQLRRDGGSLTTPVRKPRLRSHQAAFVILAMSCGARNRRKEKPASQYSILLAGTSVVSSQTNALASPTGARTRFGKFAHFAKTAEKAFLRCEIRT